MHKKLAMAMILLGLLVGCDAKDDCLDKGGSYNEQTKQCELP